MYISFSLRLDFITFATAQPTAGTCIDTFTVSGATTVAPTICGDNSGQHSKTFTAEIKLFSKSYYLYFIVLNLSVS